MRKIYSMMLTSLILTAAILGCEKSPVFPQETFPVVATVSAVTVDHEGVGVSVPVNFRIYSHSSAGQSTDKLEESLILRSSEDGYVEYRHQFFFQGDEQTSIIADVSGPEFESIQYWTAYFSMADTPAKKVEVVLVVFPK